MKKNEWIDVEKKIPPSNKPFFGLSVFGLPCVFCRRSTKKNPIYQDWRSLDILIVKWWMEIPKEPK